MREPTGRGMTIPAASHAPPVPQTPCLSTPLPPSPPTAPPTQVLSSGKIVFHGPREEVLPFFQSIGFECPERKGVADFLQVGMPSGGGVGGQCAEGAGPGCRAGLCAGCRGSRWPRVAWRNLSSYWCAGDARRHI